jgi:hypothetical protein
MTTILCYELKASLIEFCSYTFQLLKYNPLVKWSVKGGEMP